jgi:hypothetical protein
MNVNLFKPGDLVRFTTETSTDTLAFGLAKDGQLVPASQCDYTVSNHYHSGKSYSFPKSSIGLFIEPSRDYSSMIGIVMVDDKLLYVNYAQIAPL